MKTRLKLWFAAALAAGVGVCTARAAMTHAAATLDTRAMVLAEILPESCTYATTSGDCVTLTVTFTADLSGVGPFALPDNMGPIAFNMNSRTVTGRAGSNGGTSSDGGVGSPVFRVGGGTTITIIGGSGSITGGAGGDGKKGGAGAYAFVNSSGGPFAVSDPGGLVRRGADGRALLPSIPYRAWNETTRQMEDCVCTDYTVITAGTTAFEDGQWYVVRDPVRRGTITVNGTAHLILCDGATLTANGNVREAGVRVVKGRSLAIYGQTLGTGALVANGGDHAAGIGGGSREGSGAVTIDGGRVTAKGGWDGAGIGSGSCMIGMSPLDDGGNLITINGGQVSATGGGCGAGIGGGWKHHGGQLAINGGTVDAVAGPNGAFALGDHNGSPSDSLMDIKIVGGSVKTDKINTRPVNGLSTLLYCVTVKVEGLNVEKLKGFKVEGLGEYGTNDIYPIGNDVYLWLPDGTHRFTISDGEKTLRYCALVRGTDITVQPLGPVGFFVNGKDVSEGYGTGWTYGGDDVLTLSAGMTYVLSGEATNNLVQVKVAASGATVVLSNAVVFAEGRPALDVAQSTTLLMAGGESYLVSTNESAAVSVAEGARISVDLAPNADRNESAVGVFNFGAAVAISGKGTVRVEDGTFGVWADVTGLETTNAVTCGAGEKMMTGKTPEGLRYAAKSGTEPCILIGPAVTVTVRTDIPHVTLFTVSNAVEALSGRKIGSGMVYDVMQGDDVFVGYTLEAGYVSRAANPLAYPAIADNVTVDANAIPTLPSIPYRAWNENTRQMEDCVCTDYTVVTAETKAFEDGQWYVVRDSVTTTNLKVNGAAHLILCDDATLTVTGVDQPGVLLDYGKSLTVYGQSGGSGTLKADGGTNSAGIGSGSRMSATAGDLTVDGGIVLATGQGLAAGIGGSDNNLRTIGWKGYGNGGKVTINGGRITATPGYGGSMGKPAAIGGGSNGAGGDVVIRGGTVNAIARNGTGIGMGTNCPESKYATLTIDGGSVKAQTADGLAKNAAGVPLHCVIVKVEGLRVEKLRVEGLGDYGTNDIYAVEGRVYLWLPDGTHRFSISDGEKTLRYCAVVRGTDITVQPLAPVGFFVNGTDVNDGPGTGWTYDRNGVLSLNAGMTYVLSGEATNNLVQVKVAASGATVVLSNAVVFAEGRPALAVTENTTLLMAGGESYLAATNESAAVSVAENRTLTVGLAPNANSVESAVGVFNFGAAVAISGKGTVKVDGGTFCVWADVTGLETTNAVTCGEGEVMMTGKTPEEVRYATESGTEPCIIVGPAVTVTVKDDIPHASGFTVSNAVEEIPSFIRIADGTVYRVMLGDDVFVGYTVEEGCVSRVPNPLVYAAIEGDVTVDADALPVVRSVPYRAWNEATRQMEDQVCTNYTVVTEDMATLEDGQWYVVRDPVSATNLAVNGAAHLILCDGAWLTAAALTNGALAVYGQAENVGALVVTGAVDTALTVVGGNVKADRVTKQVKNAMGKNAYCVKVEGVESVEKVEGVEKVGKWRVEGLERYGIEKAGLIDGKVYLWLPNGEHWFTVSDGQTTRCYYANVDGADVTVDPLEPLGFRVNGVDVFEGKGAGWSYDGSVLTLDHATTYVLSGAATNDEVQVKVAASGATAVLSNAVVFASGRPAAEVAQGAVIMTTADAVMKAGETPGTLKYTTIYDAEPCILAGPAVTVTVKAGLPHVTDFTVSNAVEEIRGFMVVDGTACRVLLGEDVFVGYTVEDGYVLQTPNPLVYAAVEGDVTVDAGSIRTWQIFPYRAWNETTRRMEVRACTNYTVVAADTATFEDGRWYVVTGTVGVATNAVVGAAHLILCDGARLTAAAVTNGALAVYGQAENVGALVVTGAVDTALTVVGGNVKADRVTKQVKNAMGEKAYCVKCEGIRDQGSGIRDQVSGLQVSGLEEYGIEKVGLIDGRVYLWLPNGMHRFGIFDGERPLRYCAVVNGKDVTVEPLGPVGFFVNGTEVSEGSGTGWTYDVHGVLTIGAGLVQGTETTYVLSGEAMNDEVQVKVVQRDADVILSNAVVMASGRPALVVEARDVTLRMAGGASYLVATNGTAAVRVPDGEALYVERMTGGSRQDPTLGVCSFGDAVAIAGGGSVRVSDGTFFVWADVRGLQFPNSVVCEGMEVMMTGKTPETLRYATESGTEPCILIAPGVDITVRDDIPHVTGFTVSNAVEEIRSFIHVPFGSVYRVMVGDDVYVGYTLEEGYVPRAANPLVYRGIEDGKVIGANEIPSALGIPYRAWNETTRRMEDRVCTNYTFVAADTATFEDGRWYVVTGTVGVATNAVVGAAHLILCDGTSITASALTNGALAVYGQAENVGALVVTGAVGTALTVVGGNVKADRVSTQVKNAMGEKAYCVKCEGIRDQGSGIRDQVSGLQVSGLERYGIEKVGVIDGVVYLWLPDGTHRFSVSDGETTNRYCAVVNGKDVTVEPLGPVGFFVDGIDIGEAGAGDGWHYQEKVLTLGGAKSYVLSGEATNDEVQVSAAADGATAVLSNAVVFTEGRPAVVVAQGAVLAVAANQVLRTGDTPETLGYALTCGDARCVLSAPGAVIAVKDIPHVSDVVVSNLTGTVPGVLVPGGTVYRVLLDDDIFIGYAVAPGYISPAENPLRYAAGCDITVDEDTIPVISDTVDYIDRWNGRDETVVVTGNYVFVDADLTTLASGVTYVVAGTVTNRNLLSLTGPATLVVCDGATLVAEGGFTSADWPAVTNALSIHGQTAGDGLLFAKDFRGVDTAVHGITTVTDGIFGGQPVFLGGTVSANVVSNGQLMAVAGGNVCIENRFAFAYDGAERPVHSVICPVPGVTGRVTIEGLAGYCTGDIFPVDGVICLYLPEGEHVFTVNGVRMRALVLGDGTIAERDVGGYLAYGRGGELLGAFARLTNAVHAAKDGGTVKLTNDCHEAGAFILSEGAAVTLDGCGYRLTLDATDFNAPSALVSTNATLHLRNLVLTRAAVSRRTSLLEVAAGGVVEMRDCAVTNCDASASPLISAANGGFSATRLLFAGNTASALVQATAGNAANTRFAIANWSAAGNACDELFSVGNLSGRMDACEIGAGEQSGNACRVADLVVDIGPVCLCGAPPLPKVRLAGFAMSEDALHSHLVYRDAPPQDGVVVDVSSPDARIGSVIVSNAFNVAVAPQDVTLVTPGCRVAADAFDNLRLERAWAQPFIVRTVTGAQTNYASYASAEEAISRGGRDLLLMSYEEGGNCRSTLSGNVAVPSETSVSLDTVRLSVTASENWTAPSPDPVTLDGDISVAMNGTLWLGNVIPGANHEIFVDHNASVMVEALPPQDRYLHFRFSQKVIDHVEDTGVVIGSTRLASDVLRKVCAVLNEGYELVPASDIPEGLNGALWLIPSKYYEAWIKNEETLRPSFIGAMESANGAVGGTNVTMYAISYTNETDGSVIGGYSSWGRGITVGGANGFVMLTVGSKRICVKGTGERTEVKSFSPPTQLHLDGSTLRILKDSVLKLEDVNVTGTFTLAGEGLLDLTGYKGSKLTVSIDRAPGVGYRPIARGNCGLIELAPGQEGKIVVNSEGVICWQLGVTYEYHQIENGKLHVKIFKNGKLAEEWDSEVIKGGKLVYTYTDPETGVKYDLNLYAIYVDVKTCTLHVAEGTKYLASDGTYKTLPNNAKPPADMMSNEDLTYTILFPDGRTDRVHVMTPTQEKDVQASSIAGVQIALLSLSGILALASTGVTIAEAVAAAKGVVAAAETLKDIGFVIGTAELLIDFIRLVVNVTTTITDYRDNPLAYKGKGTEWSVYPVSQFNPVHGRCANDNYPHGKIGEECLVAWRRTHTVGAEALAFGSSFIILDGRGEDIDPFVQKLFIDPSSKMSIGIDIANIIKTVIDIIVMTISEFSGMTVAGIISLLADKASAFGLAIAINSWKCGFFEPPLDGSVTVASGCDYTLRNMQFDGSKSDYGKPRSAPILVAKTGAFLEFSACQLNNFSYSSPSGLVYVSEGATLILKDFTSTGNSFTGEGGTATVPPILVAKGATVWVCGATDVASIGAVGADLRIGYGPHGGKAAQAAELSGSGSIRIEGTTCYGLQIGSLQSPATSNGLDKIVSKSYSAWVKPAVGEDGKSSVWELRDGSLLKEFEPIQFAEDAPFSISVSQSALGRSAKLTGGLVVPTQKVRNAFPLEFSLISTDDLGKQPFSDAGSVTVNAAGYFTNEVRNLQSTPTRHFRLKYRWKGAPDPVR